MSFYAELGKKMDVRLEEPVGQADEEMALEWEELQAGDENYEAVMEVTFEDFQPIHEQLVICNRLLGIIVAFYVIVMIWTLTQFVAKLVTHNITNYF